MDATCKAFTLIDWLVSKKGVQHVDYNRGKNCSGYLKAEPIPFRQHLAAPADAGALHEPIWFEDMSYADTRKCYENKNQNKTKRYLLHATSMALSSCAYLLLTGVLHQLRRAIAS